MFGKNVVITLASKASGARIHICRDCFENNSYMLVNRDQVVVYKGILYDFTLALWHEGQCCVCKAGGN